MMPREGESSTQPSKVPLKRGDACLYCRKRRIRCSAEKPSCQHCKGKRECVYDNGKPISRVRQLEDKVAQLEGLLKGESTGGEARRPSEDGTVGAAAGGGTGHPPLIHHSSSNQSSSSVNSGGMGDTDMGQGGPQEQQQNTMFGMEGIDGFDLLQQSFGDITGGNGFSNDFFTFGGSMFGGHMNDQSSKLPDVVTDSLPLDPATMFDFSTLDPNFMSLVNSFDSTFQTPAQPFQSQSFQPQPQRQPQPQPAAPPPPPQTFTQTSTSNSTSGAEQSTGLTPFLNPDFASPSASDPSPPVTSGFTAAADLAPTPGHHFEHLSKTVSYNVHGGPLPTAAEANGSAGYPKTSQSWMAERSEADPYGADGIRPLSNILGDKSPEILPDVSTVNQKFSDTFRHPADTRAGLGTDLDQEGYQLVGGWIDANDLPRVARDHLLDLFFSGMRMFSSIFHIPRFFASLTLPISKRPHPCLMHSMYLMASRISSSPSIRALEKHFYSIASRQLEESIAKADRLFDATRAATILATYKYSNARYHEGWMMIGLAARLGVSCGLHQIPSSVFKPSPLPRDRSADLIGLLRQRAFCIPPPADAIELGERINAFWSIFMTERCGSISAQWPPSIHDDIVSTPYPKPIHEYELGLVSASDDQSISDLYDPSPPRQTLSHYASSSEMILRLRALAILERASKLMYLKPEPEFEQRLRDQAQSSSTSPAGQSGSIDEYLFYQNVNMTHGPDFLAQMSGGQIVAPGPSSPGSSATQGKGWQRCAKVRTPKAYEEVKLALLKIEVDLPPERRTDWTMWDGRVQDWHYTASRMDNYTLHFLLGCAWMFLFDVFAYNAENPDAVNVARRLTQTIRCMRVNVAGLGGDFDVFIAMTWSFISKILIREVKRLQALGDTAGAALIETDVEVIIQALKSFGQRYNIAGAQALRAERYRKSTLDEMKFMEKDDVDESIGGSKVCT